MPRLQVPRMGRAAIGWNVPMRNLGVRQRSEVIGAPKRPLRMGRAEGGSVSEWILEIKEGSYADHERPCEEWHRIELNLDNAKMKPLIHCRNCRYYLPTSIETFYCDYWTIDDLHDNNGFCAWAEPKEEA